MTFPFLSSAPRPAATSPGVLPAMPLLAPGGVPAVLPTGMPLLATGGVPTVLPTVMPLGPLAFDQLMQVSVRRPAPAALAEASASVTASSCVAIEPMPVACETEAFLATEEIESEAPERPAQKTTEAFAGAPPWLALPQLNVPASPPPSVPTDLPTVLSTGAGADGSATKAEELMTSPRRANAHAWPRLEGIDPVTKTLSAPAAPAPVATATLLTTPTPDRVGAPTTLRTETGHSPLSSPSHETQPRPQSSGVERTGSPLAALTTAPLPVTTTPPVATTARPVEASVFAVAGMTLSPTLNSRAKARAADFAADAKSAVERLTGSVGREEKNFLNVADESVKSQPNQAGIAIAKPGADMTARAFPETSFLAEQTAGVPATSSFDGDATDFETALTKSGGEVASAARTAVNTVLRLVETHAAAKAHESPVVTLNLRLADDDLAIRVEWREGAVHTEFRTESAGLRAALGQEWSGMVADATPRGIRFADAQITGTNQNPADLSQGGGQSGREQPFARSHAETGPNTAPARMMRPAPSPEPAPVAAWSPLPAAHLSTFA